MPNIWEVYDNIPQKVEAHVISIKHIELEMDLLSTTMNPSKLVTLPSNTIQNPKKDGNYMEVTTRVGKQTIDPPMTFVVKDTIRKDKEVVETSGELVDDTVKEERCLIKWSPFLNPHHHSLVD